MLGPQSFMATASWGCTVAVPSKSPSSVPATAWFDLRVSFSHLSCLPCACRHPCALPVGLTKLFQKFGSLGFALPHLFLRRNIGLHNDYGMALLISLKLWCINFLAMFQGAQKLSSLVGVRNLSLIKNPLFHSLFAFCCSFYHHFPHIFF